MRKRDLRFRFPCKSKEITSYENDISAEKAAEEKGTRFSQKNEDEEWQKRAETQKDTRKKSPFRIGTGTGTNLRSC
jgi:hypothetical protein